MGFNVPNIFTNVGNPVIDANQVNANFASISSVLNNVFDVTYYGAQGDGVTDDAPFIQDAINASAGFGVVFFPGGTYLVGTSLTLPANGISLVGDSANTAIMKVKTAGTPIINDVSRRTGTFVSNLTFDGNGTSTNLVTINGGNNHNTTVTRCVFQNISGNEPGLLLGGQNAPVGGSKKCSLQSTNIRVDGCLFTSLATGTRENLILIASESSNVTNCTFSGNSCNGTALLGLWAYCYGVTVSDCTFVNNQFSGVGSNGYELYMNEGTHALVTGCIFDHSNVSGSWSGIAFMNVSDAAVVGCSFDGYTGEAVVSYDWISDPDGLVVLWPISSGINVSASSFFDCATGCRFPLQADGTTFGLTTGAITIEGCAFLTPSLGASAISIGGSGHAGQSVGPVTIGNNNIASGSYSGTAIGLFSGINATMTGNIIGDSSSSGSAGVQIDAALAAVSVSAFGNYSANHVAAWKLTSGAVFTKAANNFGYNPVGAMTAPTVGASPWTYTNSTGVDQTINVSGGTVSAISANGVVTGLTSGSFFVPAGKTLVITYTAAPTVTASGN